MKVSVTKPAEPCCTIKLDLGEARLLYSMITGEVVPGYTGSIVDMRTELAKVLAGILGIVKEGNLFAESGEAEVHEAGER